MNYNFDIFNNSNLPASVIDFLTYLETLRFTCDLDAVSEGTVVFAHEPMIRLQGPLLQCQLLESPLLNLVNFQTLIATKASRVCRAAQPTISAACRSAGLANCTTARRPRTTARIDAHGSSPCTRIR